MRSGGQPPFSIISQILRFYKATHIRFFLFAPTLTLFSLRACGDFNFILAAADVTYENGAVVPTSFITNLEPGGFQTVPELVERLEALERRVRLPKYAWPRNVVSAALLQKCNKVRLKVPSSEYTFIRRLDCQQGSGIFGGGFLLSEKAAAEKAAAEKAAAAEAIYWPLSEREQAMVKMLGVASPKELCLQGGRRAGTLEAEKAPRADGRRKDEELAVGFGW